MSLDLRSDKRSDLCFLRSSWETRDRGSRQRQSPSITTITVPCVDRQKKLDQTCKSISLSSAALLNLVVCLHFLGLLGKIAGYWLHPRPPNSFRGSGAGHWDQTTPVLGSEEAASELSRVRSFGCLSVRGGWKQHPRPPLKPRTKRGPPSFIDCST